MVQNRAVLHSLVDRVGEDCHRIAEYKQCTVRHVWGCDVCFLVLDDAEAYHVGLRLAMVSLLEIRACVAIARRSGGSKVRGDSFGHGGWFYKSRCQYGWEDRKKSSGSNVERSRSEGVQAKGNLYHAGRDRACCRLQ